MPQPWAGSLPVTEAGFAFAQGEFYADASGQNRHRRATLQELKAHFASGSDKDHPAHWFEAQLIHYGLQPSKTKSVARMRLFDAVNAGKLKVPADLTKLEGKLKKEWTKKDREAKKASSSVDTKKTAASGGKRKADGDDRPGTAKKPKTVTAKAKASTRVAITTKTTTTTTKTTKTTKAASTSKATPAKIDPKRAVGRGGASASGPSRSAATSEASTARPKQTARARRGGISQGPSRSARDPSPEPAPRKKQTARRSNAFFARGRIPAPALSAGYDLDLDDAPPPDSEYPGDDYYSDSYSSNGRRHSHSDDDDDGGATLAPLGLLNGAYEIDCPYVADQWSHYDPDDFFLIFTLAGSGLWGKFDLGVYEGVLSFEERPWESSHDRLWFKWRGREDQGPIVYGDNNEGWIKFLGDGRIEGWLDHQSISFSGRRSPGQGTRSDIDARTMRNEWDGYSEDAYEQENRDRWH